MVSWPLETNEVFTAATSSSECGIKEFYSRMKLPCGTKVMDAYDNVEKVWESIEMSFFVSVDCTAVSTRGIRPSAARRWSLETGRPFEGLTGFEALQAQADLTAYLRSLGFGAYSA